MTLVDSVLHLPLCLNIMFPGTTYSEADFFAPSRLPAESLGPLARPWAACVAFLTKVVVPRGRRWACFEQRLTEFSAAAKDINEASDAVTALYIRGCSISPSCVVVMATLLSLLLSMGFAEG